MNIYCNFIETDTGFICSQCGANLSKEIFKDRKPFGVCALAINNKEYLKFSKLNRESGQGTPFGVTIGEVVDLNVNKSSVGTELKKLLSMLGIKKTKGCKCNDRETKMNRWTKKECYKNLDTIVGWLKAEAKVRNIFFSTFLAKILVLIAIWKAKN